MSDDAFISEGEGCSLWYDEYSNVISTWFFLQPSIAITTKLNGICVNMARKFDYNSIGLRYQLLELSDIH